MSMSNNHKTSVAKQAAPPLQLPDIEHRKLTVAPHLTNSVLRSVGACVYDWDIATDFMFWSEGAADLLKVPNSELLASNRAFNGLLLASNTRNRETEIKSTLGKGSGGGVPYRIHYALSGAKTGAGEDVWVEDSGAWYGDSNGIPVRAQGLVRIINERRSFEEQFDCLAPFDPLTGLYNRSYLNTYLDDLLSQLKQSGDSAAFMVVGIDHFELINSVYGYEAGDAVIVEMSKRLTCDLRKSDVIGRFSGAQLGVVLHECDERSLLIAGHRIRNLLRNQLVETDVGPIAISTAIGGVVIPENADTARLTFDGAHNALLESRRERDSSIISYRIDPVRVAQQKKSVAMAEQIISALNEGRIHLAFQPIVDATTHEIEFFEALIRLESDKGAVIAAGEFIEIAQELGLIRLVDHHALDLVIETLVDNPDARLSFNVSNETACDPEWLSKLALAAKSHDTLASRLVVEITESHAVESLAESSRFISSLHDLGFRVALDDFGAGYTSFKNLKELDFDLIKIDGHFARKLDENPENAGFIKALVDLAKLTNAKTIIEWVEDSASAEKFRQWGLDYLQGYKFGKPQRHPDWPQKSPITAPNIN